MRLCLPVVLLIVGLIAPAQAAFLGSGFYIVVRDDLGVAGKKPYFWAGPFGTTRMCALSLPADTAMSAYTCESLDTDPGWPDQPGRPFATGQRLGWVLTYSDEEKAAYYKPPVIRTPAANPRLQERLEFSTPAGGYRSATLLAEFDCLQHRWRTLTITSYEQNNLMGTSRTVATPGEWSSMVPRSVGEAFNQFACARPK